MPALSIPSLRQYVAGLRALLLLTVAAGLVYPLVVTGVAQVVFHDQANGSLVRADGRVVGSSLIGQTFLDGTRPDSAYFQSRPSASDDDPLASGASNLGPENRTLITQIRQRRAVAARLDGVAPSHVPADALLASGSGLDPQISPAYAAEQVDRVARTRGMEPSVVRRLVAAYTQGRTLGFLGEPRVNVLLLNLALDRADSP